MTDSSRDTADGWSGGEGADSGSVGRMSSEERAVERLIKSRQRVADHGEVFTPAWLVEDMLDLVKDESERVDSRFLEPACGSGNFIVPVLRRKLTTVQATFGRSEFERRHHGLLGLMCIYGIEKLLDNATECRANMVEVFDEFIGSDTDAGLWKRAAVAVTAANIVCGDATEFTDNDGEPITMPEWGYLGRGRFQRRDFTFEALVGRSKDNGTLLGLIEETDEFFPIRTYPPMTVGEIAG